MSRGSNVNEEDRAYRQLQYTTNSNIYTRPKAECNTTRSGKEEIGYYSRTCARDTNREEEG